LKAALDIALRAADRSAVWQKKRNPRRGIRLFLGL